MQNRNTSGNTNVPTDTLVADLVNTLDAILREDFEERAAIIEFDAVLPRAHAECLALLDVLHRHPEVLTGITVLQIELDGETQWVLTTDLAFARRHVADIGATEIGTVELAEVLHSQYGGIATLTPLG